jgi:hypothetical protein
VCLLGAASLQRCLLYWEQVQLSGTAKTLQVHACCHISEGLLHPTRGVVPLAGLSQLSAGCEGHGSQWG